ncbi:hypothetical protein EDF43_104253 [Rathayibacter sp. PhB179]|nr:hypothetical protein EDF49_104252 [Rathayibacter sp. PhB192]TCM28697.1 hypothetical protein EDF43_104253 [Rathayibacter sp. PhB179]
MARNGATGVRSPGAWSTPGRSQLTTMRVKTVLSSGAAFT